MAKLPSLVLKTGILHRNGKARGYDYPALQTWNYDEFAQKKIIIQWF